MLQITHELLKLAFHRCLYPTQDAAEPSKPHLFGIRGAVPMAGDDNVVEPKPINWRNPRCTIGIWLPDRHILLYHGSTVPHKKYISGREKNNNQLLPGRHQNYTKGWHRRYKSGAHRALRQTKQAIILRNSDDRDFDYDDTIYIGTPYDNIHCAFTSEHKKDPLTNEYTDYGSAGCQVICGRIMPNDSDGRPRSGDWQRFFYEIYGDGQGGGLGSGHKQFDYHLFDYPELAGIAGRDANFDCRVGRYGGNGELISQIQVALEGFEYTVGKIDGDFGPATARALIKFQLDNFDDKQRFVDCWVGPWTASKLGIQLPPLWGDAASHEPGDSATQPAPKPSAVFTPKWHPDHGARGLQGKLYCQYNPGVESDDRYLYVGQGTTYRETSTRTRAGLRTQSTRRGIAASASQLNSPTLDDVMFFAETDPAEYWSPETGYELAEWKLWCTFIRPTARNESGNGYFGCLNTYDRAYFTYGFFQLAAHTPNTNLVLLFKELLKRVPDEASYYFPDLALRERNGGHRLVQVASHGDVDLESVTRQSNGERQVRDFMEYLNDGTARVDSREATNAARLVHWAHQSSNNRRIQIEVAIKMARKKLSYAAKRLPQKYGADLNQRPIAECVAVMDINHQGRGKFSTISRALNSTAPLDRLCDIGQSRYRSRTDKLRRFIRGDILDGDFASFRFDGESGGFVGSAGGVVSGEGKVGRDDVEQPSGGGSGVEIKRPGETIKTQPPASKDDEKFSDSSSSGGGKTFSGSSTSGDGERFTDSASSGDGERFTDSSTSGDGERFDDSSASGGGRRFSSSSTSGGGKRFTSSKGSGSGKRFTSSKGSGGGKRFASSRGSGRGKRFASSTSRRRVNWW